jgi:hypothetical protein
VDPRRSTDCTVHPLRPIIQPGHSSPRTHKRARCPRRASLSDSITFFFLLLFSLTLSCFCFVLYFCACVSMRAVVIHELKLHTRKKVTVTVSKRCVSIGENNKQNSNSNESGVSAAGREDVTNCCLLSHLPHAHTHTHTATFARLPVRIVRRSSGNPLSYFPKARQTSAVQFAATVVVFVDW